MVELSSEDFEDDATREQLVRQMQGSCLRKVRHESSGLAAIAALGIIKKHPDVPAMGAYRCRFCHDWHLTSLADKYSSEDYLLIENPAYVPPLVDVDAVQRQARQGKKFESRPGLFRSPMQVLTLLEFYYAHRAKAITRHGPGQQRRRLLDGDLPRSGG